MSDHGWPGYAVTKVSMIHLADHMLAEGGCDLANDCCNPDVEISPDAMRQDCELVRLVVLRLLKETPAARLRELAERLDPLDPPGRFSVRH